LALPYRWQLRLDRLKRSFGGMFGMGGGEQQPRPKICPACGSLVGISANRCHECGTSLVFSLPAIAKSLGGFISAEAPVTYVLFVVNLLLFVVSVLATNKGSETLNLFGNTSSLITFQLGARQSFYILYFHEWWRMILAMFLHANLLHFGMNSMGLLDLGPRVEATYGSARFLFLYILTGFFGSVTGVIWNVYASGGLGTGVGASGALCGLIGILLGATLGQQGRQARETRAQMTRMILYLVALGLLRFVDNAAHFGGLISGIICGKLFAERLPMNAKELKRAYFMGFFAGAVVIASFVFMMLHFRDVPTN
jgi:membrane associated rhomboid family serine protease